MGQDTNWDLRNYHLYNGYAFLTHRTQDIAPAQLQTYFNPFLDAVTYALITHVPPRLVGFLLGAVQGLNFWLVFRIGEIAFAGFTPGLRRGTALVCATMGVCGVIGLSQIGTIFHDLTTAAFVLGGVFCYLKACGNARALSARSHLLTLLLGGALIGVGAALKYTLVLYAVASAAASLLVGADFRARVRDVLVWGLGITCGFLACAVPWMLGLERRFASPVFPLYNAAFRSPYAPPNNFDAYAQVPRTLRDALKVPFLFTIDRGEVTDLRLQDLRYATVYLLAAFALGSYVLRRLSKRDDVQPTVTGARARNWILAFIGISWILWLEQFGYYRFIATLELLAPIAMAVLLAKLLGDGRQVLGATAFLFALNAALLRAPDYGRVPWSRAFLDVAVPKLPDPSRTTVVMTSLEPMAYVIPAFDPKVRFVRVESNFFHPFQDTQLSRDVRDALAPAERDYRVLTVNTGIDVAPVMLRPYGLSIVPGTCAPLKSNIEDRLVLCRAVKAAPNDATTAVAAVLTASPNPVRVCDPAKLASTTLSWAASGVATVEVRVASPTGSLFTRGGNSGSATTDAWIGSDLTFYLVDATGDAAPSADHTLAQVRVNVVHAPCP